VSDSSTNPAIQPVIQLDNVAIRYRVLQERVTSLKEYAIRRLKRTLDYKHYWALQNLNLSVYPGESLGIIGPNGAGKSTLLKVISRVLSPTQGRVRVYGRVCPLLELGAGFDHDLTGRENIFLNGTILGYSRREIAHRLDRIIDFSGLRDFIDAPLRTYSSGMVARLGFAVATDEVPDILIIDEILSVGDEEFQRKSADRLAGFRHNGTTLLIVSHHLDSIKSLCSRAIFLERGRLQFAGAPESVITNYLDYLAISEKNKSAL
jgi:ABC-type polysaccharide/polyol phosphate transport system ATPase subunit